MAELINLRQAKKRLARNRKEKQAEENRQASSMPGRSKKLQKARREKALSLLEGHRLEKPGMSDPSS